MLRRLQPNLRWVAVLPLAFFAGCDALAFGGSDGMVPAFEVNPFWPKPLEYPYIFGPISGITVAPDGNILVVTRYDQANYGGSADLNVETGRSNCCKYTPAVLEFAPDGTLVRQWGGPDQGYPWPSSPRGLAIDPDGNIWIGGGPVAGTGAPGGSGPQYDGFVLKFSRTGQHLATFGQEGQVGRNNASTSAFAGANDFAFDGNVAYVADGYGNNRVAVVDVQSGQILRTFGAYGNPPSDADLPPYAPGDTAQQFRSVTCVEFADDLLYVCDQGNNRIQVFDDERFVREVFIAPETLGNGSVTDIAFSPDERFMYVADGMNERVYIVDRESLTVLTSFGVGGRYPSHFRELGGVAVDRNGNVFTAEDGQGRRIQQFRYIGLDSVRAVHQGALWPTAETR
jgi:DNA-binding beta-propeller fold protein YncE